MPIDWDPFVELVRTHQRFLLTTHIRPDGDGLGSMLALADVLQRQGKEVRRVIASALPARYEFLDPDRHVQRFNLPGDDYRNTEVVIVLDTGTWNQLGDMGPFLTTQPAAKAIIDHHRTQDDLGAVRFIDTSAEATGRLVFEAIRALGEPLTERAATGLLVALAMDTGWFRHSNTTPATFMLAAELMRAGARPEPLYDLLFENNSLPRLKLTGLILDRLRVECNEQAAYTEVYRTDYPATGATPADTEDLVNFTMSLAGVEVGLFFMEQPRGGIKVSFRSRSRIDVARLAEQFGGGGHNRAAGATLNTTLEEARRQILDAVRAALSSAPAH